jgi:mannose-6-phosphate isomerase-like protein (cupin superfamily)
MLRHCALAAAFALASVPAFAQSATHVSQSDIQKTVDAAPPASVSDQQIRMVDAGGYHVGVGVVSRPGVATQTAIVHDKLTEVYYVLEGTGTLVTGGTMVDRKALDPGSRVVRELTGPSATGPRVENGESRRIGPGDSVIIPAGVPHWFENVQGTIKYLVVRVDPERLLETK